MNDLLKFITCGSVDDGKSTLIGHILYDAKLLYTDQEKALELDSKVGSRSGKIDYSLLLDGLMAEREQGITIDVAYRYFTTERRSFIVADTPGHEEYTRNMAVGASFADLSVILLDATKGVLVQTRRHARICKLMGIQHFVFAVNKMDLAGYSQLCFFDIQREVAALTAELDLEDVIIIPVSATEGDNVTARSPRMPWYSGAALLEYLETVDITQKEINGAFCMPVQRVCRPNHQFRGFQGQIESGSIDVGDQICVYPSGEHGQVSQVLVGNHSVQRAETGQPVTLQLTREIDVSRGCILSGKDQWKPAHKAEVTLLWMDDVPLSVGKEYLMKLGTKRVWATVETIDYLLDVNTGSKLPAQSVEKNGIARCRLSFAEPIMAEMFAQNKALGALILIDRVSHMTAACGVVEALDEEETQPTFTDGVHSLKGSLFDTWTYRLDSDTLGRQPWTGTLRLGDSVPLIGESFHYPEEFDVVSPEQGTTVLIRHGAVQKLLLLKEYVYTGVSVLDQRGFRLNVRSQEDWNAFLHQWQESGALVAYQEWSVWAVTGLYTIEKSPEIFSKP
ncbi:MAG: GTP-binding protein [Clostridiales bacterium]|nr:GTP-binding protein [Clostridiales bacterium]